MRICAKKTMLAYFVSASLFPVTAMEISDKDSDKEKQSKIAGGTTTKTDFLHGIYKGGTNFHDNDPNKNFEQFSKNVNGWMEDNAQHASFPKDLTSNLERSLRTLNHGYYYNSQTMNADDIADHLKLISIFSSYWKNLGEDGHLINMPIEIIDSSMQFADRLLLDNLKFYSEKCQDNVCAFSLKTGLIDPETNDALKNSKSYQNFYRDARHNFRMLRFDTASFIMNHFKDQHFTLLNQRLEKGHIPIRDCLSHEPEQNLSSLPSTFSLEEKESPSQETKSVKFLDRDFFDVIQKDPIQEKIQTLFAQINDLSKSLNGQEDAYLKLRGEIQSAIKFLEEKYRAELPIPSFGSSSFRLSKLTVSDDLKLIAALSQYLMKMNAIYKVEGDKNDKSSLLTQRDQATNCYFNFEIKTGVYEPGFTVSLGLRQPSDLEGSKDYADFYNSVSQQLMSLISKTHLQIGSPKTDISTQPLELKSSDSTPISPKQTDPSLDPTSSHNSGGDTSKKSITSSLNLSSLQEPSVKDDPTREARHNPIFLNQVLETLREDSSNEALLKLVSNIGSWVNNPDSQEDFYQNLMNNISYSISKLYEFYFNNEDMTTTEDYQIRLMDKNPTSYTLKPGELGIYFKDSQDFCAYFNELEEDGPFHVLYGEIQGKNPVKIDPQTIDFGRFGRMKELRQSIENKKTLDNYHRNRLIETLIMKSYLQPSVSGPLKLIAALRDYALKINNRIPTQFRTAYIPEDVIKATDHVLLRKPALNENWGRSHISQINRTIDNPYFHFNNEMAFSPENGLLDPVFQTGLGASENYRAFYQAVNDKLDPLVIDAHTNTIMERLKALRKTSKEMKPDIEQPIVEIATNQEPIFETSKRDGHQLPLSPQQTETPVDLIVSQDLGEDLTKSLPSLSASSLGKSINLSSLKLPSTEQETPKDTFSVNIEATESGKFMKKRVGTCLEVFEGNLHKKFPNHGPITRILQDAHVNLGNTIENLHQLESFMQELGNKLSQELKTPLDPEINLAEIYKSYEERRQHPIFLKDVSKALGEQDGVTRAINTLAQNMESWIKDANSKEDFYQNLMENTVFSMSNLANKYWGSPINPERYNLRFLGENPDLSQAQKGDLLLYVKDGRSYCEIPGQKAIKMTNLEIPHDHTTSEHLGKVMQNEKDKDALYKTIAKSGYIPATVSDHLFLTSFLRGYVLNVQNSLPNRQTFSLPEDVIKFTNHILLREPSLEKWDGSKYETYNPYFHFNNERAFSSDTGLIQPKSGTGLGTSEKYSTFYKLANEHFEKLLKASQPEEKVVEPQLKPVAEVIVEQRPEVIINHQPELVAERVAEQPVHEVVIEQQPVHEVVNEQQPVHEVVIEQQPVHEVVNEQQPVHEVVNEQQPVHEAVNEQQPVHEVVIEQQPVHEAVNEQQPVHEAVNEQQPVHEAVNEQQPVHEAVNEQQPVHEAVNEQQPEPRVKIDVEEHMNNLKTTQDFIHLVHDINDINPEQGSAAFPQGIVEKATSDNLNAPFPISPAIFLGSSSGGKVSDMNKLSPPKPEKEGIFQALFNKLPDAPPLGVGSLGIRKVIMRQTQDLKVQDNSKKNPGKTPNKGNADPKTPINAFDCSSKEGLEHAKTALRDKKVQSISLHQIKNDDLNQLWPHMDQLVKLDIEFHKAEDALGRKPLPNLRQLSISIKDQPSIAKIQSIIALFPNLSTLVVSDQGQENSPSSKIKMTQEIARKWPNLVSVSVS